MSTVELEYQLTPELSRRAKSVMSSSCKLRGIDYLNSFPKKALDRLVAIFGLSASSPLIALSSAAVYLQDRENPLYDGGFNNPATGEYIPCLKVRTMRPGASLLEHTLMNDGLFREVKCNGTDKRVTPLGSLFRRMSLDELPQFWHVLEGGYSLVGPRRYTATEWDLLIKTETDPMLLRQFLDLLKNGMKFGLTGLAMVILRGNQNPDDTDNKIMALNVYYGEEASFISDLRIIGWTPRVLLKGK